MALVEFQNNQAPYLNAENLNNNFNEINDKIDNAIVETSGECYIKLKNNTVIMTGTDGSTFVAGNNNNVVLRPNGSNNSTGQAILSPTGILSAKNIDGVYLKAFAGATGASATSVNGYGILLIVSSQFVCLLQLANTTLYIKDIYGTHGTMNASISNNIVSITGLYNWDHYILIGSDSISNISVS